MEEVGFGLTEYACPCVDENKKRICYSATNVVCKKGEKQKPQKGKYCKEEDS
jgi:hypothetical protein